MQFRLLKQRQKELDLKTICPSLHNDPAFSADPHSNPYSVTSHNSWLSPPPLGHPVLKRSNIVSTPHDTVGSDSDSDFHLIQPPNSPVIPSPSGSNSSPQLAANKNPLIASSASSFSSQAFTYSIMSQGDRLSSLLPPPKKENNRMIFRRQSAQPKPTKSFFSSIGNKQSRRSELPAFSGHATLPPPSVQHSSPSVAHKSPEQRNRLQDLDQVDELDETNPWGIPIHHDGPYEAVHVQLKRVDKHVPSGLSNNGLHALQANGQTYIPPQVPTGVSLNLSPGQILPRQFLVPFIQSASVFSTLPPPDPYIPHVPVGPVLTPLHEPQYKATTPDVDSGVKVLDDLPPIKEAIQHTDDVSFKIGLAMLEPEDSAPVPSPRVFLSHAELPDEQGFVGPVNLESDYRRVPSPLGSAQPEPSGSQSFQNARSIGTFSSSNKLDAIQLAGHSRNDSDPPMYSEYIDDEDANHQLLSETPSKGQHQSRPSSPKPATMANTERHQYSDRFDDGSTPNGSRGVNVPPDRNSPGTPAVTRDQHVQVAPGTQHISLAQSSPPSPGDRPPSPSLNKRDVQSTHYSTSTYSSSQFQNGSRPPPHRHLPKRLVMPAPLNTGPLNTTASLHIGRTAQSQISSHINVKQTHFQPPMFNQHFSSRSPLGNLPMAPMHYQGNTRAEDVSVSGGRKLLKRTSMINAPAPITVSFAPPIIGINHNATDEKLINPGKMAKRFLSKRKT